MNRYLLLGAGFSNNFGLPLAKEIWGEILNSDFASKNRENQELMDLIQNEYNFEIIYNEILSHEEKFDKNVINDFQRLLEKIYMKMDRKLTNFILSKQKRINLSSLKCFINRFSNNEDNNGIIFTLNQDLFFERFFMQHHSTSTEKLIIPFINKNWYDTKYDIPLLDFETIKIDKKIHSKEPNYNNFLYAKLHGSFDWRFEGENRSLMVIGTSKKNHINKYEILKRNFSIFENNIKDNSKKKILVIGYSFNDSHINYVLKKSNCELYIVSPEEPSRFYRRMLKNFDGNQYTICKEKVKNYYKSTLNQIFPESNRKSSIYNELERDFF